VTIPYPSFDQVTTETKIFKKKNSNAFDLGIWRKHINFSVCTSTEKRQPCCVAVNILQGAKRSSKKGSWKLDDEIDSQYQLNDEYYKSDNWDKDGVWDRGHMAMRASTGWGATSRLADAASKGTYVFSNACLQHANLNQDEWLEIENWVRLDAGGPKAKNITVFSGPFYDGTGGKTLPAGGAQFSRPTGNDSNGKPFQPAEIPAGFFKVVSFMGEGNNLSTTAYLYRQDEVNLEDRKNRTEPTDFLVPLTDVEEKTGIIFPPILHNNKEPPPTPTPSGIFIAAAFVNPAEDERANEWVSIANYSSKEVDITGWTLSDGKRTPLSLAGTLESGATTRLNPLKDVNGQVQLANSGGNLTLKNKNGETIDRKEWTGSSDGEVNVFTP